MYTDKYYLQLALDEAQKGKGFCSPNPAVGAIIVKNQQIIARGFHKLFGSSHAEVLALNQISMTDAADAILYVTLEPCCHWGKTPPCTNSILDKGIAKVIYGLTDPNPQMQGKSIELLKQKGIKCELIEIPAIQEFYQSYCYWHEQKKPWITAKIAISIDGKITQKENIPFQLTGEAARQHTHLYRNQSDALLTTVKTIICDDPQFNVRLAEKNIPKNVYILDRKLQLPLTAKILTTAKSITLFYDQALRDDIDKLSLFEANKINCIPISVENNLLNIKKIIEYLGEIGIHDLFIEAGGTLTEYLLQQHLLNQFFIYIAPKVLGQQAISAFKSIFDFKTASKLETKMLGDDIAFQVRW